MHTEKFARESLPCVRGGAEHSEAEGLLETEKSAAKLWIRDVFYAIKKYKNY